jgi:hypothetical protein
LLKLLGFLFRKNFEARTRKAASIYADERQMFLWNLM